MGFATAPFRVGGREGEGEGRGRGRGRGEGRSGEGGSPLPTPPELGPGGNAPTLRPPPALPRPLYGPGITWRPPQPRGARPGTAWPGPGPGERVPRPGCFRGKALPAPLALGCPRFVWSRLLQEGVDRRRIKPLPKRPKRPAGLSDPVPARGSAEGPFSPEGCPFPELRDDLQTSRSLAARDPHSARTDPPAPLRGLVNLGIPAPLLRAHVTDTSPRPGHPARNAAVSEAPGGAMLRPAGARSGALPSLCPREKSPKHGPCVSAGSWDRARS